MTLYGLGPSRSFRCLWALEEAGIDYDFISLDLTSKEDNGAKSAEYLKLNPQGKVPTLTHGDFVLTESAAIINYINACSKESFIPQKAKERARYDEIAFFCIIRTGTTVMDHWKTQVCDTRRTQSSKSVRNR